MKSSNFTILRTFLYLLLALIFVACTKPHVEEGQPNTDPLPPVADLSGSWSVVENISGTCPTNPEIELYTVTVDHSGNAAVLQKPAIPTYDSGAVEIHFKVSGDRVTLSKEATYSKRGGTVTITAVTLLIQGNGGSLTGTTDWRWSNGIVNCSGASSFAASRTVGSGLKPAAPSDANALANTPSSILISWRDNSDNESSFVVERSAMSGGGYTSFVALPAVIPAALGVGSTVSWTDTNLVIGTYKYRVKARNSFGDSGNSNEATATTQAITTAPESPVSLTATSASSSSIQLQWSDQSNNETGFKIERAMSSCSGTLTQVATVGANVQAYTDNGLSSGTLYCYRVRAYNEVGNSGYSNTASATTATVVTLPAAPSNLIISNITSTSALMTWTDNSSNETGFEVGTCSGLVSVNGDGGYSCASGFVVKATKGANSTSHAIDGLTANTSYSYFVRAVNSAGSSANIGKEFTTLTGIQTVTLSASVENGILIDSFDTATANTVYRDSGFSIGCNWLYSTLTGIQSFVCAGGLVRFDTSAFAGKIVDSAVLKLKVSSAGVGYYPRKWHVRAMYTAWSTTTVTWNVIEVSQYYTGSSITLNAPSYSEQVYEVDVKSTVSNWASGAWNNYGFVFGSNDFTFPYATSFDAFSFYGRLDPLGDGPKLVVTYH